jgi:hypothetical protein
MADSQLRTSPRRGASSSGVPRRGPAIRTAIVAALVLAGCGGEQLSPRALCTRTVTRYFFAYTNGEINWAKVVRDLRTREERVLSTVHPFWQTAAQTGNVEWADRQARIWISELCADEYRPQRGVGNPPPRPVPSPQPSLPSESEPTPAPSLTRKEEQCVRVVEQGWFTQERPQARIEASIYDTVSELAGGGTSVHDLIVFNCQAAYGAGGI